MLLDVFLAVGLLASTSSQLRPDGSSIGPGEICLAIWIVLTLAREAGRLGPPITGALFLLVVFWTVFAFAMCVGTMTAYAIGDVHDPIWFVHDIFAYAFVAPISCLTAVEPGAERRLNRVAWLVTILGSGWLALQVAHGWGLISLGDIDPWEWDRFRGFCDNANQLALVCAIMGLLSLHLAEASSSIVPRLLAFVCGTIMIFVGRLTKSDAFLLVLLIAVPGFIVLKLRTWQDHSDQNLNLRSALATVCVLATPVMLAFSIPVGISVGDSGKLAIEEMTRGGATGETEGDLRLRIHLWNEAIRRGLASGTLGLGPGPHLKIPPSIAAGRNSVNQPSHVEHPEVGLFPNFEAHNTLLDLFVQGGLLAVAAIVWLAAKAFAMTYRVRLDALTALIVGIATFSFFHLIVRHPIVWFAISFCLVTAGNARWLPATRRVQINDIPPVRTRLFPVRSVNEVG